MRAFLSFTFVLWVLGTSLLLAQGDSGAGDIFYRGFNLNSEAEKLEESGNMNGALAKYQEAQQLIATVSKTYPNWQSDVVTYRLRMIEQAVARLQQVVASTGPASPTVPATPVPSPVQPAPVAPQPAPGVPMANANPMAFTNPLDYINQLFVSLQRQNVDLQNQISIYQDNYKIMQDQHKQSKQDMEALRDQMKNLMGQADTMTRAAEAKNEELLSELEKTRTQAQTAQQNLEVKTKEFEESKKNVVQLQTANDKLAADMKTLQKQVEEAKKQGVPTEDLAKLTNENNRLKKELEVAQAEVEKLRSDNTKKDAEIASLRTQVLEIQKEMTKLRQENTMYQGQVAELTLQLKDLNTRLEKDAKKAPTTEQGKQLAAENKMLKGILLRQLRIQQRTMQAKELVMEEMKKSESTSQTLVQNLEDMTSEKFQLSKQEEALFTEPELKEIFTLDQRVYATLQAPSSATKANEVKGKKDEKALAKPVAEENLEEKFLTQASEALQKSDFVSAAKFYQETLRVNPKNVLAIMNLAGIRLQEKKYSDVESWLKKGLAFEPENDALHYRLGICYFQQNRLNEALSHFEKAASKNKSNAKTHHYLGIISSKLGNRTRAESEFTSALAIDPNYGDAYFNLAVLHATSSPPNWSSAKQHYDSAIAKGVKADVVLEKLINDFAKS